ncbi:MAG: DUF2141 domain-containing protein [Spirochaetes bacterium]|jgi:uncharacterized protein (DUF2141 family)|nr:DUF2141 domain-containing protein [Spirochaetota bacterium]
MKKLFLLLVVLASIDVVYAETTSIALKVTGIEHIEGNLMLALYDSADSFNNDKEPVQSRRVKVTKSTMVIQFDDLVAGEYGLMFYQDRNENNKLDKFPILGIPLEPYGVSNNPKLLGPPSFKNARFKVVEGVNEIHIPLSKAEEESE